MTTDFGATATLIRDALERQGLYRHMGARVDDIAPGRVVMAIARRDEVLQQYGFFHGGAIAFLVDNATTCAAATMIDRASQSCLTAEYKLNIVSPAEGDDLVCSATVVKPGRKLTVVEAKVHSHKGGREKLVAVALATIAVVEQIAMT